MLDDLVQTIEMLQKRIKEHGSHIGAYESRTRVTLIDPMLSALGWDVDDPGVVEIEPRVAEEGWADYALLGGNGRPVVFVEAKRLGEDLSKHTNQTIKYAIGENMGRTSKIQYAALTNGNEWRVFDLYRQDLIWEASITAGEPAKTALQFLALWRRSLQDGGFDQAAQPLVEVAVDAATEPVSQAEAEPAPSPNTAQNASQPSATTVEGKWTPLTGEFAAMGNPPPKAIKFQDGTERPTRYWFEIIRQTALHLVEVKLLTRENCQIRSSTAGGSTRYLLSLDGKHSNGKAFAFPVPLGDTGIIVEANFSAVDCVRQAKRLLEHFGLDPARVTLKLS